MTRLTNTSATKLLAAGLLGLCLSIFSPSGLALDINTANAEQLQQLKGVGPKRAKAIISYREQHGPFTRPEQLLNIKGVGKRLLERNRGQIDINSGGDQFATKQ